ncbi:class I SAM-dependent methyltransferase [Nocardia altamirensis]|uniref:class I SAM-dependent methyltransferase n=1 Tax=Nocardia altamirensis TaxID=472158 RepID=UPI00083FE853|nr:class I SAM-dependent methyltransferase [Nocardia altamirensis]
MSEREEQLARLARGWDEAVTGYESYYVPRFAPWVRDGVNAVIAAAIPEGPVLVPCCGTFPELDALVAQFPDREIVGIDLSAGMVRRARERAAGHPRVRVVEGDASTLDPRWTGRCAAVVSIFGLQQLPEPDVALRSWTAALRPGGRLSVVFWPSNTESEGPFALLSEVLRARIPAGDQSWEHRLVDSMTAAGAATARDELRTHPMTHPDAATCFHAHTRSGPLRALADARGSLFIDQLRNDFLHRAPAGPWTHHPRARHLVADVADGVRPETL